MPTPGPDAPSLTCAAASRARAEPLAGTAAVARTWLLVEQPGPWGARAVTESRLDARLGAWLEAAATSAGVRVALVRRPGGPADRRRGVPVDHRRPHPRRIVAAHTAPGESWVRSTVLRRPEELRDLPLDRLGAGDHGGLGEPHAGDPLTLVCTNGRRDRCCALRGRPLAAELAATGGADVWEATHLGGHRFAPTLLVLPYGYAYGRASAPEVKQVVENVRRGRTTLRGCRGRSTWGPPGQVADLAVREDTGERGAEAVRVAHVTDHGAGSWTVTVAHQDGRHWAVAVREDDTRPPAPASCGAQATPRASVVAVGVTELSPGR